MNRRATVSFSPWLHARTSAPHRYALRAAMVIAALLLAACAGTGPGANGPPVGNGPPDDDGASFDAVPPGIVATVTGFTAQVDNPFATHAVGLYAQGFGYEPEEAHRLATGTVSAAGQLSATLPALDEARMETAPRWPYLWCGGEYWFHTGTALISDSLHVHPPFGGAHRSLYLRTASFSGPSGPVVVHVWYVYSDQALDRTCAGDAFNADVDVRIRPGWNVLVHYTATADGVFYRTGEPAVSVPWAGPVPSFGE